MGTKSRPGDLELVSDLRRDAAPTIGPFEIMKGAALHDEHALRESLDIVTDLHSQLMRRNEISHALQDELDGLRSSLLEMESTVTSRNREIERIRQEIASLQTANEQLMVELGTSEKERGETSQEVNRLREEVKKGDELIKSSSEQVANLKNNLEEASKLADVRIKGLQASNVQLEERQKKIQGRLDQRTREVYEANSLTEELKKANEELKTKVQSLERSRDALCKIHDSLKDVQQQVMMPDSEQKK